PAEKNPPRRQDAGTRRARPPSQETEKGTAVNRRTPFSLAVIVLAGVVIAWGGLPVRAAPDQAPAQTSQGQPATASPPAKPAQDPPAATGAPPAKPAQPATPDSAGPPAQRQPATTGSPAT